MIIPVIWTKIINPPLIILSHKLFAIGEICTFFWFWMTFLFKRWDNWSQKRKSWYSTVLICKWNIGVRFFSEILKQIEKAGYTFSYYTSYCSADNSSTNVDKNIFCAIYFSIIYWTIMQHKIAEGSYILFLEQKNYF